MAVRRSASTITGAAAADQQSAMEDEDHVPLVAARRPSSSLTQTTSPPAQNKLLLGTCGSLLALFLVLLLSSRNDSSSLRTDREKAHILELALQLTPIVTQVVHRHGDRTPITPLTDAAYWSSLLPSDDTLTALARRTNIIRDDNQAQTVHAAGGGDVFGRLTTEGLHQMFEVGVKLRTDVERLMQYEDDGVALKGLVSSASDGGKDGIELSRWLRVASTDFSRTIQSVQALLVGLLLQQPSPSGSLSSFRGGSDGDVLESILESSSDQQPFADIIDVDSRHTMKMIPDPQPRRFVGEAELERELMNGPEFTKREEKMKPLALRLTKLLLESGVIDQESLKVSFGVGEDDATSKTKAEIPTDLGQKAHGGSSSSSLKPLAWNQLAEILKCLEVRGKLPKTITDAELSGVHEHNAWRWFALLSDERLGPMAIFSLAKKIVLNASQSANSWERSDESTGWVRASSAPLLHVFSGHDATLIALMCFFRVERPAVWPDYGSYLKVELLRDDVGLCERTDFDADCAANDNYYVLFTLNGEPLRSAFSGDSRGHHERYRYFVSWVDVLGGLNEISSKLPPLAM